MVSDFGQETLADHFPGTVAQGLVLAFIKEVSGS